MKKSILTTLAALILSLGGSILPTATNTLSAQSLPIQKYYAGLSILPYNELLSITKAQTLYFRTFKGVEPTTCDSGYVLFEDFLITTIDSIQFELPAKANDQEYKNRLKLAGLRLVDNGDFVTVKPDMDYFLSGISFENSQGFVVGDSLVISFAEVAQRIIYWDRFYNASLAANFVLAPEVKDRLDRYMQSLIFGEPFSTVWTADSTLREDVRSAFTIARNAATMDATKKVLNDYWAILESCSFSKCDRAIGFTW